MIFTTIDDELFSLNRGTLIRGLIFVHRHPRLLKSIIDKDFGATDADVFLQLCLMGEIVYD